jgi:hypothetical protein
MTTSRPLLQRLGAAVAPAVLAVSLSAQTPPVQEARLDTRRAQASRVELEASLAQIDTILKSPGYSTRIREAKRREAALIRERLTEGDMQVGDLLAITVLGEAGLTDTFTVGAGQMLSLPGLPPVPLRGILRSEAEPYITKELERYIRNPQVRVVPSIRLAVLGAVGRQGYYQVPADVLISDAIMMAGGPTGAANPNKSKIVRANTEILAQAEVEQAIVRGATLDQLNLRAGDQIVVDEKIQRQGRTVTFLTIFGILTSVVYLTTLIF